MFRSIRRIAEMNRRIKNTADEESYDEDGRLLIHLTVRSDNDFISPFSYDASPALSTDVADFLDNSLRPKHYKDDLHIVFHSDAIDDSEKPLYTSAVKNHYFHRFSAERQKARRESFVALIMLLIGIVILGIMILFDSLGISNIALEVFDIVAWVFLWEAADIFFLQRHVSHWLQQRNVSFSEAKISFLPLSQNL